MRKLVVVALLLLTVGHADAQRLSPQGGTITNVIAGNGLTGGGMAGAVTLNVVCGGTGLICNADSISIDGTLVPLGSGTLNYIPRWTPDGNTLGNSNLYDDGGSVIVRGGSGALAPSIGGVHMWFDGGNVGHVSSTTPNVSNRRLEIQGSPIVLYNGAATLMTFDNTEMFAGTNYDSRLGRVYGNTPDSSEPGFRSTRKAASPGDALSPQWGFGHSTYNTDFIWDYFNGSAWSGPWLILDTAGNLTAQARMWSYAGLSGAAIVDAFYVGNAVSSSTSADVGFSVGMNRQDGFVSLDTKVGATGHLLGRIGGGTSNGYTSQWLYVDSDVNPIELGSQNTHGTWIRGYGKIYKTDANAEAVLHFENDALAWRIGVDGNIGDSFKITENGVANWLTIAPTTGSSTLHGVGGSGLTINNTVQASERLRLTGQEFYQAAMSSTDGPTFLLGVNRASNRQVWLADSAALTQNSTNAVLRLMTEGAGGQTNVTSMATDGITQLPLELRGSKVGIVGNPIKINQGALFYNNQLNGLPDADADAQEFAVNYGGYSPGGVPGYTRDRNFSVYNGKGTNICFWTGSTLTMNCNAIQVGGVPVEVPRYRTFTPTTVGWYRIIDTGTHASGTIKISGLYDNKYTSIELLYTVNSWGATGSIQQVRHSNYNSGFISQARISSHSGTGVAYVDIYISSATTPGTVTLLGYGPNQPEFVSSIVVGAVPGPSDVQVLTLGDGFRTTKQLIAQGTLTTDTTTAGVIMGNQLRLGNTGTDNVAPSSTARIVIQEAAGGGTQMNIGASQIQTWTGNLALQPSGNAVNVGTPGTVGGLLNVGGRIDTTVGSGTSPGLYMRQASNAAWMIYNPPSNSDLRIYNESVGDIAYFDYTTGRVGFGGSPSEARLELAWSGGAQNGLYVRNTQVPSYAIRMDSTSLPSSNGWQFRIRDIEEGDFEIYDETNNAVRAYFDNVGRVGIGNTDPRNNVEIGNTTSNQTVRIGGIYRGPGSGYTGLDQETTRHQLVFSSWRDVQQDAIGAKIVGINKTRYAGAPWDLVQSTDLAFFTNDYPASADSTVEHMRIVGTTGRVGINTTTPGWNGATDDTYASLHVMNVAGNGGGLLVGPAIIDNVDNVAGWRWTNNGGDLYWDMKTYDTGKVHFRSGANAQSGASTEWMTYEPETGHTGIGSSDPSARLEVANGYDPSIANAAQFRISESSGYRLNIGYDEAAATTAVIDNSYNDGANSRISIRFGNTEKCAITANGNLSCTGTISGSAGGGISGLTTNYIPVATSATTLGNSFMYQNAVNLVTDTYQFQSKWGLDNGTETHNADIVNSGKLRRNWVKYSDTLEGTNASDDGWSAYQYPCTITDSVAIKLSPRGITEKVGALAIGSDSCAGDYRTQVTYTSTGIKDLRQKTVTFSIWGKSSSGTPNLGVVLGRYADNDGGSANCALNSSTWTRCSYTRTFNNTSYTDNSEMRVGLNFNSAQTYFVWGAQVEEGSAATPYQENYDDTSNNVATGFGGYATSLIHTDLQLIARQPGAGGNNYTIEFVNDGAGAGSFTDGTRSVYHYSSTTTMANFCTNASSAYFGFLRGGTTYCNADLLSSKVSATTYGFSGGMDARIAWASRATFGGTAQDPLVVANAPIPSADLGIGGTLNCISSVEPRSFESAALRLGREDEALWRTFSYSTLGPANVICSDDQTGWDYGQDGIGSEEGRHALYAYGASKFTGTTYLTNEGDQAPLNVFHQPAMGYGYGITEYPSVVFYQGGAYYANNMTGVTVDILNESAPAASQTGTKNIGLRAGASGAADNVALSTLIGRTEVGNFGGAVITASLTASVNNWAPTGIGGAMAIDITSTTGAWTLGGIDSTGSAVGRILIVNNRSGDSLLFSNQNGSSSTQNQFRLRSANTQQIGNYGSITFMWLGASVGWHELAHSSQFYNGLSAVSSSQPFNLANTSVAAFANTQITSASVTGTLNDWAPTGAANASTIRMAQSGAVILTGLSVGQGHGTIKKICPVGGYGITFYHESGLSTAANRFWMPGGLNTFTTIGSSNTGCVTFEYDATDSRWRLISWPDWNWPQIATTSIIGNVTFSGNLTFNGTATFNNNVTLGSDGADVIEFKDGPIGINTYDGRHLEWTDDFMHIGVAYTSTDKGEQVGSIYSIADIAGTGAQVGRIGGGISGRPGQIAPTTGTSTSGYATVLTSPDALFFGEGNWTYEIAITHSTLSALNEDYVSIVGFFDEAIPKGGITDGCIAVYDRLSIMADFTGLATGDKWKVGCCSGGVCTVVILDGTTQGSITTVNAPIAAGNWDRIKIVMTGTSSAAFFVDAVLSATITTNIPTTATGAGFAMAKHSGTTSRWNTIDQARLAGDLTSTRSP